MNQNNCKTIGEELKMNSFASDVQKVFLNLQFTANYLSTPINKALKNFGLSHFQYNVLRILRGQKGNPVSAIEIQNRMIHRSSNVSRILEKLLDKGLIECAACPENRRKNNILISERGLDVLSKTEPAPINVYGQMEQAITSEEALMVNNILDKLRSGVVLK